MANIGWAQGENWPNVELATKIDGSERAIFIPNGAPKLCQRKDKASWAVANGSAATHPLTMNIKSEERGI